MKEDKLKQLYFSHDIFSDKDEKIVKMFYFFRKNIDKFSIEFIKNNFFHASFGLFWEIVQYLHRNELTEEEIPMLADELRADEEFVRLIIEKFNLFRIDENGFVVSDRILKNLNEVAERSKKNKNSAQVRWLLSAFNKDYVEFFGEAPILEPSEIEALKKYSEKIPDLKKKFRDIFYTLKSLEFDKNYKPCANWLLKGNNLGRLLNGEFGALKHKKTAQEMKEEQRKLALKKEEKNKPTELELKLESLTGKEDLLAFIADEYSGKKVVLKKGKVLINPEIRNKAEEFGAVEEEIQKACGL